MTAPSVAEARAALAEAQHAYEASLGDLWLVTGPLKRKVDAARQALAAASAEAALDLDGAA